MLTDEQRTNQRAALRSAMRHEPQRSRECHAVLLGIDLRELAAEDHAAALAERMMDTQSWTGPCGFCGHNFEGKMYDRSFMGKAYGAACPRCHFINYPAGVSDDGPVAGDGIVPDNCSIAGDTLKLPEEWGRAVGIATAREGGA